MSIVSSTVAYASTSTSSSTASSYLEEVEIRGKLLYKQNENYRNIANVIEHPEFRKFFDEYLSDWDRAKTSIMFLQLYKEIEKASPVELNGYQKLGILDNIIRDHELRENICGDVVKRIEHSERIELGKHVDKSKLLE